MIYRTSNLIVGLLALLCNFCLLSATQNGADVEKRGAEGTDRTGTAMAIQGTGTGSTTPANPNCKTSTYSLVGDDIQYYACCDGTTVTGGDEVVNWDCEPARKTYATVNDSKPFYCGGLVGEANARKRCDERWKWLTTEGCFKWTECFAGVCPFEAEKRGSSEDAAFCGDGRCDASESPESCPTDCCGDLNDRCMVSNNTCPETCCSEPTCCKSTFGKYSSSEIWIIISCSIVGGIVLINLFCCCCCFCCFKKCCCNGGGGGNAVV